MSGKGFKTGTYEPRNQAKYKGHYPIKYRSSWELKFMRWCDSNVNVIQWGSESVVVPYIDPVKAPSDPDKVRNYILDFTMLVKDRMGKLKKYYVEIKPYRQVMKPVRKMQSDKTYLYEVLTYARNNAKWKAAYDFSVKKGAEFMLLTEKDFLKQ